MNDPKWEIWKLYQILTCTTVLDKGGFLVIVSMAMLDNVNTFQIFKIFNMPAPVNDTTVPTDKLPNKVPWYKLETSSIAINLTQIKYVLLTYTKQKHRKSPLWHHCDVRSPVYSMTSSTLCTVALFMKDTKNVKNYCKTEVKPDSILARAYHVIDGF